MRVTTDLQTGKPFRWNMTVSYGSMNVPALCTRRTFEVLHPHRVPVRLLIELNPRRPVGGQQLDISGYQDYR